MNRPNEAYCYLADKHYKSKYKIIREFAKEVVKEILENRDGVKMPAPFGYFRIVGLTNVNVKNYNYINQNKVRNIKYQNYDTDGITFCPIVQLSNLEKKGGTIKNSRCYHFKHAYRIIRTPLVKLIQAGNWRHFGVFKTKKDAIRK
jgi:hypothetical protein